MLGFVISTGLGLVLTAATVVTSVATTVVTSVTLATVRLGYDYIQGLREGRRPRPEEVQDLSADRRVLIDTTNASDLHILKKKK
jgi:hypothetical protein